MTTLSHTQTPATATAPPPALTHPRPAHWRISLEYGNWCVEVTRPGVSGVTSAGSYYSLGTASLYVQEWGNIGDTVSVEAPDDGADGWVGTVTEFNGNALVSWRVAA